MLSHDDFQQLLNAIEVYVDKKMMPQMNVMNAIYRLAETTIKENFTVGDRDEVMNFLQNSVINEDDFLRYRISERFNDIIKSLFDAHRRDPLSPEHTEAIEDMKSLVQSNMTDRKTESEIRAKFYMLCKQLGLNATQLDEEEMLAEINYAKDIDTKWGGLGLSDEAYKEQLMKLVPKLVERFWD